MTYPTFAVLRVRRAWIQGLTAVLLAVTTTLTACSGGGASGSATGPTNSDPKGLYALRSIDGKLPGEIYHGPWFDPASRRFYNQRVVVVDSGTVDLGKGNVWTMLLWLRQSLDGVTSSGLYNTAGIYEIDADQIVLRPRDGTGSGVSGTFAPGTIGLSLDLAESTRARAFTFRK
jgi:hypothetical protein